MSSKKRQIKTELEWMKLLSNREEFKTTSSETRENVEGGPPKRRIEYAIFLAKQLKGRTALDIGCGSQFLFKNALKSIGYEVICLDMISRKTSYFVKADAQRLPFKDDYFDLIHCGSTLQYLLYPQMFLEDSKRVLAKNGIFIVCSPRGNGGAPLFEKGYPGYILKQMLIDAGFRIEEMTELGGVLGVATK